MKTKVIALLLTVVMVMSAAACGSSSKEESASDRIAATGEDVKKEESKEGTGSDGEEAAATWEEHYKIVWGYIGNSQQDTERIAEEISKILEPIYNVSIELLPMSWGEFSDQLTLMLSGSEAMDIVPVLNGKGTSYINNGYLKDLTEYIDRYGNHMKEQLGEENVYVCSVGDFIYGIPTYKEWCSNVGMVFRKDILTEAGFTVEDVASIDDLDAIYEAVQALYPDMTMLVGRKGDTPGAGTVYADQLGDGFGVILPDDTVGTVVNYYETEEFAYNMQKMYEFAQKGWISKDCATITDGREAQAKAGNAFSYFVQPTKPDTSEANSLSTGYDMIAVSLTELFRSTSATAWLGWGIGRNCEDPERVFQVLDYMYGSPEIMNLLNWGIEGEHYVFKDEEAGIIGFPEGVDINNTTYNLNIGYEIPNQKIAYIWEGRPADLWEQYEEYNATDSIISTGFIYDDSNVSTEIAALNNVKEQYLDALGTGAVDPSVVIPKFNEALYNAGLQTVIDEKQAQLEEYLAK